MVKSFEHLSDAQLEHYGTDSTTSISDDAQRIEAHLEECADCRSRVLEHQRARFAPMADASMKATLNPGTGRSESNSAVCSVTDGPSEDDLRNLAAGLIAPDKALPITEHAARCPHCGPLLRAFTEDFSDELTAEETNALSQLKSSTPAWQKEIAGEAMKGNRDGSLIQSVDAKRYGWRMRWMLVPASLAVCAVIAFGIWYSQRETPEKVEKLLAEAYTEQRMTEYRIPDAEWGPVRMTRGAGESKLARPAAQLEAEKILAEHQSGDAGDPNWLTAKAEAEILDNNPEAAIADLTQAVAANPGSVHPEVLLAIAYAQKGDQRDDRASREKALEILNKVIAGKAPHDPAALFNRALLYQRLNMPEKAKADWGELLRIEPQNAWGDEERKKR